MILKVSILNWMLLFFHFFTMWNIIIYTLIERSYIMIIKQRPEIKASIISPSLMHTYSLGMEYIRTWFFNRVNEDAFKSIHIVDRDALDAFRHYNAIKDLKKDVPSLAISITKKIDFLMVAWMHSYQELEEKHVSLTTLHIKYR